MNFLYIYVWLLTFRGRFSTFRHPFVQVNSHPLLYDLVFNVRLFDSQGTCSFVEKRPRKICLLRSVPKRKGPKHLFKIPEPHFQIIFSCNGVFCFEAILSLEVMKCMLQVICINAVHGAFIES